MSLTSFPQFSLLPTELQATIWSYATAAEVRPFLLSHDYPIFLWWDTAFTWPAFHRAIGWCHIVMDGFRPPRFRNIMHVCRLSRMVALEWWRAMTLDVERGIGYRWQSQMPLVRKLDELVGQARKMVKGGGEEVGEEEK